MSKKKRNTPEQTASVLKQQQGGLKVAEICRWVLAEVDRITNSK